MPSLHYPKYPRNVIKSTKFCRRQLYYILYSRIFRAGFWRCTIIAGIENVVFKMKKEKKIKFLSTKAAALAIIIIPMYPTVLVFFFLNVIDSYHNIIHIV